MTKLWSVPEDSCNGCSDFSFEFQGINAKLEISYKSSNIEKQVIIKFFHVICFKHNTNYLFMPDFDSYECLCEVTDSEWLKHLKKFNPEYSIEKFKHFLIDNQNDGRFEIIAEKYCIEAKDRESHAI